MKKWLSIVLAVCMVLMMLPVSAIAEDNTRTGVTGECTWTRVGDVVTVSGPGAMGDEYSYPPWGMGVMEVIIEPGVTKIGYRAFPYSSMTEITIPDTVTEIGYGAFSSCLSLVRVEIPKSVSAIGDEVFVHCPALKEIYVDPESEYFVVEDGVLFTKDMKTLVCYPPKREGEIYTIPEGVEVIGVSAFAYCEGLQRVIMSDTVTTVKDNAFQNCSNLEYTELSENLQTIGFQAILNRNLVIPKSVVSINTTGLIAHTSVEVDPKNKVYASENGALLSKNKEVLFYCPTDPVGNACYVPDGVKTIATRAIRYPANVYLPRSVQMIDGGGIQYDLGVPMQIYYAGSAEDRDKIDFGYYNEGLYALEWHYNTVHPNAKGNINGDTKIDSTDARLVLQYFVGSIDENALDLDLANVNGDTKVDSTDARLILQYFVGSITEFPKA